MALAAAIVVAWTAGLSLARPDAPLHQPTPLHYPPVPLHQPEPLHYPPVPLHHPEPLYHQPVPLPPVHYQPQNYVPEYPQYEEEEDHYGEEEEDYEEEDEEEPYYYGMDKILSEFRYWRRKWQAWYTDYLAYLRATKPWFDKYLRFFIDNTKGRYKDQKEEEEEHYGEEEEEEEYYDEEEHYGKEEEEYEYQDTYATYHKPWESHSKKPIEGHHHINHIPPTAHHAHIPPTAHHAHTPQENTNFKVIQVSRG